MEELNELDDEIKSTLDDIDELVNEVSLYGFSDINEREIVYGITTAVGIDPSIDNVIEIGCNVGEFYFYIQRLLGMAPVGYYGIEQNEKFIDIARFRIADSNTEFYNSNLTEIFEFINSNDAENYKEMMSINTDWGVLINQFSDTDSCDHISSIIELFIKIPNKGLVITNRFDDKTVGLLVNEFLKSNILKNRFILRSDFLPGWYSFYFYNNR